MTSSDPRRPKAMNGTGFASATNATNATNSTNATNATSESARAYARFIPREELDGFAAWNPGDIAGGPAPQGNVHRAAPEAPRPDVAAELAAQLRAARQAGYQDGYRDGLVALDGFKQGFALQTTAQIGALLQSLGDELGGLQQDMARTLAVSATHLARRIVRAELAGRPELIAVVAQEAVDTLLLSARHITLRVHPDDQPLVAQGAAEVLAARGARLLGDASMTRGGVLVESDIGVIDATLEARWRRAAASLGSDEPWGANAPDSAVSAVSAVSSVSPVSSSTPVRDGAGPR